MRLSLKSLVMAFLMAIIIFSIPWVWVNIESIAVKTAAGDIAFFHTALKLCKLLWALFKEYIPYIFTLYIITAAGVIFLEERNPDRTIAWLLALGLLPGIGFIFYFLFGPDPKRRAVFKKYKKKRFYQSTFSEQLPEKEIYTNDIVPSKLVCLLEQTAHSRLSHWNSLDMLLNGENVFPAIEEALERAQRYIHLEYFSIAKDETGLKLFEILKKKVREGVPVRVIYDSVGSWRLGRKFIATLRNEGIDIQPFLPVSFPMIRRDLNFRNHRKIVVVDGEVAFTGGLNVGDMYLGRNRHMGFWRDTHVRIKGEAVAAIHEIFLNDWFFCTGQTLSEKETFWDSKGIPDTPLPMQIAASGPDSNWRAILQGYFHLFTMAQKRIWITTPYLVPDESLKMALTTSALSGVDVRIIIPSRADHRMVFWATRSNIDDLLAAGVRIFAYQNGFIHSKLVMADGKWLSVGTTNLDNRSLDINFEVQVFVYNEKKTREFEKQFLLDMDQCLEFNLRHRMERPIWDRIRESLGRLWSALL
ncbi:MULTISPECIES: cardiolipin synthase [Aminobacterium]|uniref:cardiolipin synthase n=2 Tax=Aminobacterium TaxID=81466 RepID=UPI00257A6E52|nr:cardiolipin synthase [Aminobacterium sp. UBA1031]